MRSRASCRTKGTSCPGGACARPSTYWPPSPHLVEAMKTIRRKAFVILDGTLLQIGPIAADTRIPRKPARHPGRHVQRGHLRFTRHLPRADAIAPGSSGGPQISPADVGNRSHHPSTSRGRGRPMRQSSRPALHMAPSPERTLVNTTIGQNGTGPKGKRVFPESAIGVQELKWRAHAIAIFRLAQKPPLGCNAVQLFGVTRQICRAGGSVPRPR